VEIRKDLSVSQKDRLDLSDFTKRVFGTWPIKNCRPPGHIHRQDECYEASHDEALKAYALLRGDFRLGGDYANPHFWIRRYRSGVAALWRALWS